MNRLLRAEAGAALLGAGGALIAVGGVMLERALRRPSTDRHFRRHQRIVILGAGFAGMCAAEELARLLPEPDDGEIILIDRHNFHLFTPMLTEAAGGQLDVRHIVSPLRDLPPRIRFIEGRIDAIDLLRREVSYTVGGEDKGIPELARRISADHLVLALGSVPAFYGIPGVARHALTMKSVSDAEVLRNHALGLLERADVEDDPATRRALLTFVVGGGGYTGVETMAALNDLVREGLASYPRLRRSELRMVIVEPRERLLAELTPELAAYAHAKLEGRGVEVLLGRKLTAAGEGWVELDERERIATRTLVWSAGVRPSPAVQELPCRRARSGAVIVEPTCAVPDFPGVWAVGDNAEVPGDDGAPYAPTAQNATHEGTMVARNIVATLAGREPQPFRYRPIGQLALVGKRSGVALVYGMRFSGFPAWALWRAVYLMKMPALRQRVRVGIDWMLDTLFGRDTAELPIAPAMLRDEAPGKAPAAAPRVESRMEG